MAWVAALFAFSAAYREAAPLAHPWWQDPNLTGLATIAEVSTVVMAVTWIGALVRLARLRQWSWFAVVLLTQLMWAGIAGMVCYAGSGPGDEDAKLSRPQLT